MTELLTLDIESIAGGGDGIARNDGLVVFVPRTAPGDRVRVRVEQKGRLARGVLQGVERASDDRVAPQCPHYEADDCGGCQLQHLALRAQREAKRRIVADAFRRIGGQDVTVPTLLAGEQAWRYRRKLTLAMWRSRGGWTAGLHAASDPDRKFSLVDCLISDERLMIVWREILAAGVHLPNVDRLRGAVRLLGDRGADMVGAVGAVAAGLVLEGARQWDTHERFLEHVPSLAALWWIPEGGSRNVLHDRRLLTAEREPAASFAQVNPDVAERVQAFVIDSVLAHGPVTAVDAYAGTGGVAACLASRGVRVIAIELDAEASAWSAARLPAGSRSLTARVEDALDGALPADVVILNPPRAGLDARVTARLAHEVRVRAIIYVSCDPATLARDVARLPAWRLARTTAFDMFPQTAHVETVCELVPEAQP